MGRKKDGLYDHAARYTGTPGRSHSFIYKNNFDGDIKSISGNPLRTGFDMVNDEASCGYQDAVGKGNFVRYFNPNSNRRTPRSVK